MSSEVVSEKMPLSPPKKPRKKKSDLDMLSPQTRKDIIYKNDTEGENARCRAAFEDKLEKHFPNSSNEFKTTWRNEANGVLIAYGNKNEKEFEFCEKLKQFRDFNKSKNDTIFIDICIGIFPVTEDYLKRCLKKVKYGNDPIAVAMYVLSIFIYIFDL